MTILYRLPVVTKFIQRNPGEQKKKVEEWRGSPEGKAVTRLLLAAIEDQRCGPHSDPPDYPPERICDEAAQLLFQIVSDEGLQLPLWDEKTPQAEMHEEFDKLIPSLRKQAKALLSR